MPTRCAAGCSTSARGTPLREAHLNEDWHRVLEAHGLPDVRMHDAARHTHGTLVIDELDEQVTVVQGTLGHASPTITSMLYVGRVPKAVRRAAGRYRTLMEPPEADAGEASPGATATRGSKKG